MILGAKRELEPDTKLEPEETDAAPETTPAKNGACVGSINTACAALLDFWDGGGRGASEGVGVWFIMLGVGVLLFEDKERNVLCDGDDERNGGLGWEGLEGEDVVTVFGLEGRWRERWMKALVWVLFEATGRLSVGREVSCSCLKWEG